MAGDETSRPIILVVSGGSTRLRALDEDLQRRYADRFGIVTAATVGDAERILREARVRNLPLPVVIADARMQAGGVTLLERVRSLHPDTRTVLLTDHGGINAGPAVDGWVVEPWQPAEQRLYPVLDELVEQWSRHHAPAFRGVRVVGHRWAPESHDIRDLLARHQVPYEWLDVEADAEGRRVLDASGSNRQERAAESLPIVVLPDGTTMRHPSIEELGLALGLTDRPQAQSYDLVIVGGGPAGLAAVVYAASEGLRSAVIEVGAPGGQAGLAPRIENCLGLPEGVVGSDLAHRALAQAKLFGAEIVSLTSVSALELCENYRIAHLSDGRRLSAEAVVIACGIDYRGLDVPGSGELTNRGIYYGASHADAPFCAGETIAIVGGGNSAGQAALNFVRYAVSLELLVRADRLDRDMSAYLVNRIENHPCIEVRLNTEVVACEDDGTGWLRHVYVRNNLTGHVERLGVNLLFVYIGAEPQTEWLRDTVECDDHGFVLTGSDLGNRAFRTADGSRDPFMLETSVPGVFAAGDVRHQSMRRVASAVGEGSTAVAFVHRYLGR